MAPDICIQSCRFPLRTLPAGSTFFRYNRNAEYRYQAHDRALVPAGRFNRDEQHCFYVANHPVAALFELLSYHSAIGECFQHTYVSACALTVVDLGRHQFPTPRTTAEKDARYSDEEILVNQHVTCPRGPEQSWIPETTQGIADYYRTTEVDGLLYQTAIAHNLTTPGEVYGDPRQLWNFAFLLDPADSERRLTHRNVDRKVISPEVRRIYSEGLMTPEALHRRLKCASFTESAMLAVDSPHLTPSLPIYGLR